MAWILTIDVAPEQADSITDQLWTIGTNGVAELPNEGNKGPARLLAGFETEAEAETARFQLGGSVAPVDPTAWGTPPIADVEIAGHTLTIEAGHSFGHGKHPTTRLCLQLLERHLRPGQTVLDIGCGSGVLSLAAKALGAPEVTAIDIDPAAIAASGANAKANNLTIDVSCTPIAEIVGPFDVVVVNMLVVELEPIADHVVRCSGGLLIVSGALIDQASRWTALFPNLICVDQASDGEWAGRTYRLMA